MTDVGICFSSPHAFDNQLMTQFCHWCSGKTPNDVWKMQDMRELWNTMHDEYALEFPLLEHRMKRMYQEETVFQSENTNSDVATKKNAASISISTVALDTNSGKNENENEEDQKEKEIIALGVIFSAQLTSKQRLLLQADDVNGSFRIFRVLERYLCNPPLLSSQTLVEVPLDKQSFFIENYWALDSTVVRELLSSKRMQMSRKDMEELMSVTNVPLRSITRQFHNLKRIYGKVEENTEGYGRKFNLLAYIQGHYLLSDSLARKYAAIIFFIYSRFTIPTSLLKVSCEKFENCAASILACLVSPRQVFFKHCALEDSEFREKEEKEKYGEDYVNGGSPLMERTETNARLASSTKVESNVIITSGLIGNVPLVHPHVEPPAGMSTSIFSLSTLVGSATSSSAANFIPEVILAAEDVQCWSIIWRVFVHAGFVDPDKELLSSLREIRLYLTGEILDSAIAIVRKSIEIRTQGAQILRKLDEAKMRIVCKSLMQIGANLALAKEYRDFVEDVVVNVGAPLSAEGLTPTQIQIFLVNCSALVYVTRTGVAAKGWGEKKKDWIRFVLCARLVLKQLST
jgi:hypothetical protein